MAMKKNKEKIDKEIQVFDFNLLKDLDPMIMMYVEKHDSISKKMIFDSIMLENNFDSKTKTMILMCSIKERLKDKVINFIQNSSFFNMYEKKTVLIKFFLDHTSSMETDFFKKVISIEDITMCYPMWSLQIWLQITLHIERTIENLLMNPFMGQFNLDDELWDMFLEKVKVVQMVSKENKMYWYTIGNIQDMSKHLFNRNESLVNIKDMTDITTSSITKEDLNMFLHNNTVLKKEMDVSMPQE